MSEKDNLRIDETALLEEMEIARERLTPLDSDIVMPPSLRAENLMHLLEGVTQDEPTTELSYEEVPSEGDNVVRIPAWRNPANIRKYGSLAAALVLVVGVAMVYNRNNLRSTGGVDGGILQSPMSGQSAQVPIEFYSRSSSEANFALNYSQIREVIGITAEEEEAKWAAQKVIDEAYDWPVDEAESSYFNDDVMDEVKPNPETAGGPLTGGGGNINTGGGSYSSNPQVVGVDEADIVKVDDRYIYTLHNTDVGDQSISIVDSEDLSVVSTIELSGNVSEIYLTAQNLVLIETDFVWRSIPEDSPILTETVADYTDKMFDDYNGLDAGIRDDEEPVDDDEIVDVPEVDPIVSDNPGTERYSLNPSTADLDIPKTNPAIGVGDEDEVPVAPMTDSEYSSNPDSDPVPGLDEEPVPEYESTPPYYGNAFEEESRREASQGLTNLVKPRSAAIIYDISDRSSPKEQTRFEQEGDYVSSRLIGDNLYLISNKYMYSDVRSNDTLMRDLVPFVRKDGTGAPEYVAAEDIVLLGLENAYPTYSVISAVDVTSNSAEATTKAVLGNATAVYMSEENLYLADRTYLSESKTSILRFAVDGLDISFKATAQVKGNIQSQFSMDEKNGYLRVASSGADSTNIYVMDGNLTVVGRLEGIGENQYMQSVRFLGDYAYLSTYNQDGSLLCIDLSNPFGPTYKGDVKLPGFPEYLHPVSDKLIVGLGQDVKMHPDGVMTTDGMKLSLYDVSDPMAPEEIQHFYLGNSGTFSDATYDHHAFFYDGKSGIFGFPITIYATSENAPRDPWSIQNEMAFSGFMVFDVTAKDGFEILATLHSDESMNEMEMYQNRVNIRRGVCIGDKLYTVSDARIMAFSLDTFEKTGELQFS